MRKLFFLSLAAGLASAQLPQDTLRNKVYAPKTVKQKFPEDNPSVVEERRTEHSVHFRRADGVHIALLSQHLHWTDPETGQTLPVEPALWTLDNGWRLEGGPVKTRIVRGGGADLQLPAAGTPARSERGAVHWPRDRQRFPPQPRRQEVSKNRRISLQGRRNRLPTLLPKDLHAGGAGGFACQAIF